MRQALGIHQLLPWYGFFALLSRTHIVKNLLTAALTGPAPPLRDIAAKLEDPGDRGDGEYNHLPVRGPRHVADDGCRSSGCSSLQSRCWWCWQRWQGDGRHTTPLFVLRNREVGLEHKKPGWLDKARAFDFAHRPSA